MALVLILIANDLWLGGLNRTISACAVDWQRCKVSLRYIEPLKSHSHTSCHADMNLMIWHARKCNLLSACRAFDCFDGKALSPFYLLDTAMRWKHFRVVPTKLPMWQQSSEKSPNSLSEKEATESAGKSTLNTPTQTRAIRAWKRREFPQLPHQKFKHFAELELHILQWNDLELSRSRVDSKKFLKSGEE